MALPLIHFPKLAHMGYRVLQAGSGHLQSEPELQMPESQPEADHLSHCQGHWDDNDAVLAWQIRSGEIAGVDSRLDSAVRRLPGLHWQA